MSRTRIAASRLAWASMLSISSARAASAVSPAIRSSSLRRSSSAAASSASRPVSAASRPARSASIAASRRSRSHQPLDLLGVQPLPLVDPGGAALHLGGLLLGGGVEQGDLALAAAPGGRADLLGVRLGLAVGVLEDGVGLFVGRLEHPAGLGPGGVRLGLRGGRLGADRCGLGLGVVDLVLAVLRVGLGALQLAQRAGAERSRPATTRGRRGRRSPLPGPQSRAVISPRRPPRRRAPRRREPRAACRRLPLRAGLATGTGASLRCAPAGTPAFCRRRAVGCATRHARPRRRSTRRRQIGATARRSCGPSPTRPYAGVTAARAVSGGPALIDAVMLCDLCCAVACDGRANLV